MTLNSQGYQIEFARERPRRPQRSSGWGSQPFVEAFELGYGGSQQTYEARRSPEAAPMFIERTTEP